MVDVVGFNGRERPDSVNQRGYFIKKISQEIAADNGLNFKEKNPGKFVISRGTNVVANIDNFYFDINLLESISICRDKEKTFLTLRKCGYKAIEHRAIHKNMVRNSENVTLKTLQFPEQYPIVIKPNFSAGGGGVCLVFSEDKLRLTTTKLFSQYDTIAISPFLPALHEYRLIVLNQEIRLFYIKILPAVVGDGKRSLEVLIKQELNWYCTSEVVTHILNWNQLDLDVVLGRGETRQIYWQHNLNYGGKVSLNVNSIANRLKPLALDIARSLNMNFISIDFFVVDASPIVMEVNPGIVMENFILQTGQDGYNLAKSIYQDAILQREKI